MQQSKRYERLLGRNNEDENAEGGVHLPYDSGGHGDGKTLGRLLPTPREVSADCGMCWCAPVTERETVAHIAEQNAIEIEGVYELML